MKCLAESLNLLCDLILEKKIIPPRLGVGFNRNISLFLSLENYSDCILAGSKKINCKGSTKLREKGPPRNSHYATETAAEVFAKILI